MRARPASVLCGICVVLAPAGAALSAVPAAAAVPAAPAPTSAVALAAGATGSDEVFYRGDDGSVRLRTHRDGVWSGETSLGGRIVGAPAAAVAGDAVVVVGRGSDDAAWSRTRTQGVWGGWQRIGGGLSAAPAVAAGPGGGVDVLVRGADDGLWTAGLAAGGTWSAWTSLGGRLSAGPAAVGTAAGTLEAYATLADHSLARRTRTGTTWSGWEPLGGLTYSAPAAAQQLPGSATVIAVRGTNNALYLSAGTGGWEQLGGVLVDAPALAAVAGGLDLMGRGTDRAIWTRRLRPSGWSAWSRAWTPTALPPPPAGRLGTDWTRVPTSARVVALTFDAGANADGLPAIRATLRRQHVPATFFLTGQWARNFPDRARGGRRRLPGRQPHRHPPPVHHPVRRADHGRSCSTRGADHPRRPVPRSAAAVPVPVRRRATPTPSRPSTPPATSPSAGPSTRSGWKGTSGGQSGDRSSPGHRAARPGEIVLMHVGSNPDDGTTLDAAALPKIIAGSGPAGTGSSPSTSCSAERPGGRSRPAPRLSGPAAGAVRPLG